MAFDWKSKFPDMTPVTGAPPLFRLNGCGLGIYGKRDVDAETRSYVTTYCICFLFIPVIPLCAYRVADASSRSYYFLGRVPLSQFAKVWNYLLIMTALVGGGLAAWQEHVNSPGYQAGIRLAHAQQLRSSGQTMQAADLFAQLVRENSDRAPDAGAELHKIIVDDVAKLKADDVARLITMAINLGGSVSNNSTLKEVGTAQIEAHKNSDPAGALLIFKAAAPILPDPVAKAKLQEDLLHLALKMEPQNVEMASELAQIFEKRKELGKCEELLAPLEGKLGASEGARILGEIYSGQDKIDSAFKLLSPYAEGGLKKMHDAEKAYEVQEKVCVDRCLSGLRNGTASQALIQELNASPEEQQQKRVSEYIAEQLKGDPSVKACQDAIIRCAPIVPVALDLGIVRLRRAQKMSDVAERRKELEGAEKLFVAIRGAAGESDEYKVFYGQVLYWLGKQDEGKKLFDELLASKKRSQEILTAVSHILREVGDDTAARVLAEEAYNKETDRPKKSALAHERAMMFTDLDDEIKWLRLVNSSPSAAASLNAALGQKALMEGKDDEAANLLRISINAYASMPKSASTLNNGALSCFSLYGITYNPADFSAAVGMMEEASKLAPSDSVLLNNLTHALFGDAALGVVKDAVDLKTLQLDSKSIMGYLYANDSSRDQLMSKVRAHPSFPEAMATMNRLLLLAPRLREGYETMLGVYLQHRDINGLRELHARLKTASLDLEGENKNLMDFYKGEKSADNKKSLDVVAARLDKLLASNPSDKKTLSIAMSHLANTLLCGSTLGYPVAVERVVESAEKARELFVSYNADATLAAALYYRAAEDIAKQNAEFAGLRRKTMRSLNSQNLIAYCVLKEGEMRDAILQNADVKRAVALCIQIENQFPQERDPCLWPLLKYFDSGEADKTKTALAQDEFTKLSYEMNAVLSPLSSSAAMSRYFMCVMNGKESEGQKILNGCAGKGVPMPF